MIICDGVHANLPELFACEYCAAIIDGCETCGNFIAGGTPFSRYCDNCADNKETKRLTNG